MPLRRLRRDACAGEYALSVDEVQPTGREAQVEPLYGKPVRGPVASTSCLAIVLLAVFAALVVLPASLWLLGIACGGS
jgi:hypothetical protein